MEIPARRGIVDALALIDVLLPQKILCKLRNLDLLCLWPDECSRCNSDSRTFKILSAFRLSVVCEDSRLMTLYSSPKECTGGPTTDT